MYFSGATVGAFALLFVRPCFINLFLMANKWWLWWW